MICFQGKNFEVVTIQERGSFLFDYSPRYWKKLTIPGAENFKVSTHDSGLKSWGEERRKGAFSLVKQTNKSFLRSELYTASMKRKSASSLSLEACERSNTPEKPVPSSGDLPPKSLWRLRTNAQDQHCLQTDVLLEATQILKSTRQMDGWAENRLLHKKADLGLTGYLGWQEVFQVGSSQGEAMPWTGDWDKAKSIKTRDCKIVASVNCGKIKWKQTLMTSTAREQSFDQRPQLVNRDKIQPIDMFCVSCVKTHKNKNTSCQQL